MFGITAFAQSPFAALGGNVYNQALSESVAPADAQAAFLSYRSQVRAIAVNPPTTPVTTWPTLPVEVWETV